MAMLSAVAAKGYGDVTVSDVTERASVSRATFYQFFDGREACFEAAYDAAADVMATAIGEAVSGEGSFEVRLARGIEAYCTVLETNRVLAQAVLFEADACPAARLRRMAALDAWAEQLVRLAEGVPGPPIPVPWAHAAVGAVTHLSRIALAQADARDIEAIAEPATRAVLVLLGRAPGER